jgi:SAM-dependent methyltransferase
MESKRTHGKSPEEHSKIVREGYDKAASQYMQERAAESKSKEILEFINLLPEKAKVLDIGCGGGVPILKMMLKNGFIAVGIDFSKSMLEIAKKNVPNAELIYGDITKADFESNSFDGIISSYATIHIHRSLHSSLYNNIHNWLKPGGIMLVIIGRTEWEEIEDFYGVDMAWSHPAPAESLQMMRNSGFEVVFDRRVIDDNFPDEITYWVLAKKPNPD